MGLKVPARGPEARGFRGGPTPPAAGGQAAESSEPGVGAGGTFRRPHLHSIPSPSVFLENRAGAPTALPACGRSRCDSKHPLPLFKVHPASELGPGPAHPPSGPPCLPLPHSDSHPSLGLRFWAVRQTPVVAVDGRGGAGRGSGGLQGKPEALNPWLWLPCPLWMSMAPLVLCGLAWICLALPGPSDTPWPSLTLLGPPWPSMVTS